MMTDYNLALAVPTHHRKKFIVNLLLIAGEQRRDELGS
jgi:hypothetical protein